MCRRRSIAACRWSGLSSKPFTARSPALSRDCAKPRPSKIDRGKDCPQKPPPGSTGIHVNAQGRSGPVLQGARGKLKSAPISLPRKHRAANHFGECVMTKSKILLAGLLALVLAPVAAFAQALPDLGG